MADRLDGGCGFWIATRLQPGFPMAKSRRQKILVTGGAGYIGSVLVPALLEAGNAVTVLDNFMFGQTSLLECCADENFDVVRGDCRDERVVAPLLAKVDTIIPLAALVGAPMCDRDRQGAVTTNREAVRMLCKLA